MNASALRTSTVLIVNMIIDHVDRVLVQPMVKKRVDTSGKTFIFVSVFKGHCELLPTTNSSECVCHPGWTGVYCESMINVCSNVTCQNAGVCRPTFLNYTCECVSPSYSGRHCETTSKTLLTRQMVCKSFGYVAILCIVSVASFILLMDALRYFFGIDPVKKDLKRIRRRKNQRRTMKPRRDPHPIVCRYVYVNGPATTLE